tara:strand:+ start:4802 stop:5980 length:1179 start_codon:yes stop_codon:yes gene_type:complete
MNVPPFSLNRQLSHIGDELEEAISRVIHSGKYIGGQEIDEFEEAFSRFVGVPYTVGCNSGTDALILALRALEIGAGDEVITCSFSFFATAEAISSVGAIPVFVEIDRKNYLIDIEKIEKAITPSTKAILPVHLFGCPVDMDQIMNLASKYNLKVIEDCAQAAGAKWNGNSVGSYGDIGCFSFFPTKNLGAAGDGGAVTTKHKALASQMRELSVHGMPERYLHTNLGYNSRLDAIQAAILNIKLPYLNKWVGERAKASSNYLEALKGLNDIILPKINLAHGSEHGWNQFVIRIKNFSTKEEDKYVDDNKLQCKNSRDIFKQRLEDYGIKTIIYYPIPIHLQPAYIHMGFQKGDMPLTESLSDEVLSLPLFPEITSDEQEYVAKKIISLAKSKT